MSKVVFAMLIGLVAAVSWQCNNAAALNNTLIQQRIANLDKNLVEPRNSILDDLFYLSTEQLSWAAANFYCNKSGWKLVALTSVPENLNLLGFLSYYDLNEKTFWTAGNQLEDLKTWCWGVGGPEISYTNWAPGQPDNSLGPKYCIALVPNQLQWSIGNCDIAHDFICQKF